MAVLHPPSAEQLIICNALKKYNIVVDSVAGSGKTTTCMHIAKMHNTKKILLLTYNARLKEETRNRITDLDLNNIECHSYHSFCVKYYNRKCFKDDIMIEILGNDSPLLDKFGYDIIILDEAQDMRKLYFN